MTRRRKTNSRSPRRRGFNQSGGLTNINGRHVKFGGFDTYGNASGRTVMKNKPKMYHDTVSGTSHVPGQQGKHTFKFSKHRPKTKY